YTWQNGSHSQTCIVGTAGVYTVQVTASNGYAVTSTIVISVIPKPVVNLGPDFSICPGEIFKLDASTTADSYKWQDNTTNSYYNVVQPGTYSVTATNQCGSDSGKVVANVGTLPVVDLGKTQSIKYGDELILDATYQFSTYCWQDMSTNPTFIVKEPGNYWVIVTNTCGFTYDAVDITLTDYDIYIPNAFSPNNDGVNDYLTMFRGADVDANFEILIYDRWGMLVFQSRDVNFSWDGKVKSGDVIGEGVYLYFVRYTDKYGKSVNRTGYVTVIR
ncbi:MAG: gliding motility-associated C-terminal domain-containing protein, partial [Bacteroidia bacterium]|nr:gliding motility-associated C-terminal domain-containing protein [Bacteroidia bacterium]